MCIIIVVVTYDIQHNLIMLIHAHEYFLILRSNIIKYIVRYVLIIFDNCTNQSELIFASSLVIPTKKT